MPQSNAVGYDGSGGFGGAFYAAYKEIFGPSRTDPIVYRNRPFLRDARKVDDFEGSSYAHSIFFEDPQGGSTSFVQAIANEQSSSQSARLMIWRGREYQAIQMDAEEIRAARSDTGSLLRKKAYETKRILEEMSRRIDIAVHGGGSGIIGSFTTGAGGTLGTTTLTLDVPAQIVRFSVGQKLQLSTTNPVDGTQPTLGNAGAIVTVTGVQRSASGAIPSTITINSPLSTWVPAVAATTQYFLLRAGDGVGFGQNVLKGGVSGLKSWLPAPPPVGTAMTARLSPSDSFWGFNRNADATRLAGCTYQAQPGEKYQVSYQNAGQELFVNGGGNEDTEMFLYVSPADYTGYCIELGPQVRYMDHNEALTGFKRAKVLTQAGDFTLTADPQVEPGLFYMLDRSAYHIKTLDALPHMDQQDGLDALRASNADAQEIRWRAWYQLVFDAPGRCLVGRTA